MKTSISFSVLLAIILVGSESFADPIYLTNIPLDCNDVKERLQSIDAPNIFNISVYEAHIIAMKESNIIKPCASKLEQVIYIDRRYYYFTNSALIGKFSFAKKYVKINGATGEATSNFEP